jgi:hypothetical protein
MASRVCGSAVAWVGVGTEGLLALGADVVGDRILTRLSLTGKHRSGAVVSNSIACSVDWGCQCCTHAYTVARAGVKCGVAVCGADWDHVQALLPASIWPWPLACCSTAAALCPSLLTI